jgi:hypothetical protein
LDAVLLSNANAPIPVLVVPVLLDVKAFSPSATLLDPVVFESKAATPNAVLLVIAPAP